MKLFKPLSQTLTRRVGEGFRVSVAERGRDGKSIQRRRSPR
jgi:hypothetical protein